MATPAAARRPPLVVVNPRASGLVDPARRARLRYELERALGRRFGVPADWSEGSHDDARAALRDVAGRPLVVAVGGDGTVREVAEAVVSTEVPVAIVPCGTGNVLAASLRLRGAGAAIRLIGAGFGTGDAPAHDGEGRPAGVLRRLDLGRARWGAADGAVEERTFSVACGMGFDARMIAAAEHEWKRRLRFGAYVGAAVREAMRLTPARFRITADGAEVEIVGLVVLIANTGDLIPGRLGARQPIDPSDGRLDLLVVGGRSLLAGARGVTSLLLRTGELDGSVIRRSIRQVRVEADPPQPIQTDGDAHAPGWLEAMVLPRAVSVLVPG
jgi:diacylglycerol kinase family enzyme